MYNICLSSSESSPFCAEEETLASVASDLFRHVGNTFNFLKCCCNRMISKLNKCLMHSKENGKEEKKRIIDEKKDESLSGNVKIQMNCLYSATEFSNCSSSVCLSTESCNESLIFMNKRYLSNMSLFHASSFGFPENAVTCSKTASHMPIKFTESNKGFHYRNIKNRISRKIHSEEINKNCIKQKYKKSYSHVMLTKRINSPKELHIFPADFESMRNSSKLVPRKLSKAVNFRNSSGDNKKDVFHVGQSRSKMLKSQYCITRCDTNVISSSSYQSSNFEPALYFFHSRRKRVKSSVKSFLSYAPSRKWRNTCRKDARNHLSKSFSQINFSRTFLAIESRNFQRCLSSSAINESLRSSKNIELNGDEKSLELKVDTDCRRIAESYSTIYDTRSSIFDKSSVFSSNKFPSETCSRTEESITFYTDCEGACNETEEILIIEKSLSNMFDLTLKVLKTEKQGSTVLVTKSSYTDVLSALNSNTSYTEYETFMIHIEDEEEHNSNDFDKQQLIGQDEFLKTPPPKPAIYEPIVNKPKYRRLRSFYGDNGSKHCVICGRYETKNRRYALPTCIVKGATLFPKSNNNPWTRVVEKVNSSLCQSNFSKVLSAPLAGSGKSGFPETSKTSKRSVRRKREMLSDGGNLNDPCSLDNISRRFCTSNVEINVIDENETMSVTIIELSRTRCLNYLNCMRDKK